MFAGLRMCEGAMRHPLASRVDADDVVGGAGDGADAAGDGALAGEFWGGAGGGVVVAVVDVPHAGRARQAGALYERLHELLARAGPRLRGGAATRGVALTPGGRLRARGEGAARGWGARGTAADVRAATRRERGGRGGDARRGRGRGGGGHRRWRIGARGDSYRRGRRSERARRSGATHHVRPSASLGTKVASNGSRWSCAARGGVAI